MKNLSIRDIVVIGFLMAVLFAWGPLYQRYFAPPVPPKPAPTAVAPAGDAAADAPDRPATNAAAEPIATARPAPEAHTGSVAAVLQAASAPELPEQRVTLSNETTAVVLSSWGGGVAAVELMAFREALAPSSPPVYLDFGDRPALSMLDVPGLSARDDFTLAAQAGGRSARVERRRADGLQLVRTVTLTNRYELIVVDVLSNGGSEALDVPSYGLQLGPMRIPGSQVVAAQSAALGIDVLPAGGGESVRHWAQKSFFSRSQVALADFFEDEGRRGGCSMMKPRLADPLPAGIREPVRADTDWVAVKSQFFTQILDLEADSPGYVLEAGRLTAGERPGEPGTWSPAALINSVAAVLRVGSAKLGPGESVTHELHYYVGPKEYTGIRQLGNHREDVMEFGMWKMVCGWLLWGLNAIYSLIPSYGVAIILLTIVVRIIFWPVTHKGTESMKRMQALQPQITALREKYKDKPQVLHRETMDLYKKNKVNPFLGGCLPTLVQIPVFFALFTVLRSAVELRFAPFLWIPDLSDQEGLLRGVLPIAVNILPLINAVTMAWQSKLTPSAGDASQQKMMVVIMPVMMLFIFYTMPAALNLYWVTNQCLMIVQLLWHKRRSAK